MNYATSIMWNKQGLESGNRLAPLSEIDNAGYE